MKNISLLIFVFIPILSWGQIKIEGVVYSKADKLEIQGVQIIEKGTKNEAVSNINGEFEISVSDSNAILVFWFVGFQQKEVKIYRYETLTIYLKEDCNIDWFDFNLIGFELLTGLINTPYGGQLNFSFVPVNGLPLAKTFLSYQTNFKGNNFLNTNIGFYHLFLSCNFNADINLNYKYLKSYQRLDLATTNLTANLNLNKLGIIAGLGILSNRNEQLSSYGPTLGFKTYASRPLWLNLTAKSTFNNSFVETEIEVKRSFKFFNTLLRFYSIKGFNELTLAFGKDISYKRRR